MVKAGIDQDAITALFSQASARQGTMLRNAVTAATLKALQGRELTLENIRRVLKAAALATSAGAALNKARPATIESLLMRSVEGMDAALIMAVDANRTALHQFMDLGVGLQSAQMQMVLENLEKIEGVFISVLGKVARIAAAQLASPWQRVFDALQRSGTGSGAQASQVVAQLAEQSRVALRNGRAANVRAAQAMMNSYASLVSGVLLGMSEGVATSGKETSTRARKK